MLGYDIFDPSEVVPEFTADHGTKKGEKVDYALMLNGIPAILIEAKIYGANLDEEKISQLFRYFSVTDTHFGILTDGVTYRFFSDLEQPNTMDKKPFFEFNMFDYSEQHVKDLKRFTKSIFQVSEITDAARQLKYTSELKRVITLQISNPSDDFVKLLVKPFYPGRFTPSVRDMFVGLVRDAFTEYVNDSVDFRLNAALARVEEQKHDSQDKQQTEMVEITENVSEFSDLEIEAYNIVKAIVGDVVDIERLTLRRFAKHTRVLLDDNQLKTVCSLYFMNGKDSISIGKNGDSVEIDNSNELYDNVDILKEILNSLLEKSSG